MNTQGNTRNADGRAAMRAGGAMVAAAAVVLVMAGAAAGMKPASAPSPAPATAPTPGGGSGQPVPTLDDLLKLPKQNAPAKPAEKPAAKPAEKPMEKPAGGAGGAGEGDGGAEKPARDGGAPAEQANPLTEALELMQDASTRLNPAGGGGDADTSLDTQRLQQRAIDKLDQLISQAKKQQKKKQQQKQQQKQDQQQQQDQKQQDGQQPKQEQGKPGEQQGEQRQDGKATDANGNTLPGGQGGSLNPALDAARASWGNLPARVRDMLLQGSGEKFSTSYQQLTEEYYRKLAEKQREEKR